MEQNRYSNTIGFLDLLFLTLLGFVFLFIMSFIMMNPPVNENIEPKADIIVMMEWDDMSPHDIDLWCKLPGYGNRTVNFNNRTQGLVNLERDDRGIDNDILRIDDGFIINYRNREVLTWRGLVAGTYIINAHFYDRHGGDFDENGISLGEPTTEPVTVNISLIKLNPRYQILKEVKITLYKIGDERTAFSFTITPHGDIVNINTIEVLFINENFEQSAVGMDGQ